MSIPSDEKLFHVYADAIAKEARLHPSAGKIPVRVNAMAAVKRAIIEALAREAEPTDVCEDTDVCGWHSVADWLRSYLPDQPMT